MLLLAVSTIAFADEFDEISAPPSTPAAAQPLAATLLGNVNWLTFVQEHPFDFLGAVAVVLYFANYVWGVSSNNSKFAFIASQLRPALREQFAACGLGAADKATGFTSLSDSAYESWSSGRGLTNGVLCSIALRPRQDLLSSPMFGKSGLMGALLTMGTMPGMPVSPLASMTVMRDTVTLEFALVDSDASGRPIDGHVLTVQPTRLVTPFATKGKAWLDSRPDVEDFCAEVREEVLREAVGVPVGSKELPHLTVWAEHKEAVTSVFEHPAAKKLVLALGKRLIGLHLTDAASRAGFRTAEVEDSADRSLRITFSVPPKGASDLASLVHLACEFVDALSATPLSILAKARVRENRAKRVTLIQQLRTERESAAKRKAAEEAADAEEAAKLKRLSGPAKDAYIKAKEKAEKKAEEEKMKKMMTTRVKA